MRNPRSFVVPVFLYRIVRVVCAKLVFDNRQNCCGRFPTGILRVGCAKLSKIVVPAFLYRNHACRMCETASKIGAAAFLQESFAKLSKIVAATFLYTGIMRVGCEKSETM